MEMGGNTGTVPQLPYHFIPPTTPTLHTHHIPSTPHRSRLYVATFLAQCVRVPLEGKRSNKELQAKLRDRVRELVKNWPNILTFDILTLVYAFPTMSTRPCQHRGTRPRGLLGPSGAVLPVVTFSPTINSLSRVDFALGATNSAR